MENQEISKSRNQQITGMLTRYRVNDGTLIIDLGARRPVLSSAPCGGGLVHVRYILNHQVQANPLAASLTKSGKVWGDPSRSLGKLAARLGADARCVGLMTAVPMKQLVTLREQKDHLWVEGFITVGVSNAVRAGESPPPTEAGPKTKPVGTINIILVTNARLASSAMVGLVQVATEAKTAVILAKGVPSWTGRREATGTGTDVVAVASGAGPMLRYSGTHTEIGVLVGRLVLQGVAEGLRQSDRWQSLMTRRPATTKCGGRNGMGRKRC